MSSDSHKQPQGSRDSDQSDYLALAVIPVGIALNLVTGSLVGALKLPIYLDAIGTIVITMLVGWKAGMFVGVSSFVLASVLISPAYIYFLATQVAIALYVRFAGIHANAFMSVWKSLLAGIMLGIVAGCVSAPVITGIFDGSTGTGRDLVTALIDRYVGRGHTFEAVLLSGIAIEPIDKTIQLLVGVSLVRALPLRVLERFRQRVPIR